MEKFISEKLNNFSKYSYIFYSTSFESSANDKISILKILKEKKIDKGYIVLDLLLSKGNNFNRFVEIYVENTKIQKIQLLKEVDNEIKNISFEFYLKNKYLLNRKTSIFNFEKFLF